LGSVAVTNAVGRRGRGLSSGSSFSFGSFSSTQPNTAGNEEEGLLGEIAKMESVPKDDCYLYAAFEESACRKGHAICQQAREYRETHCAPATQPKTGAVATLDDVGESTEGKCVPAEAADVLRAAIAKNKKLIAQLDSKGATTTKPGMRKCQLKNLQSSIGAIPTFCSHAKRENEKYALCDAVLNHKDSSGAQFIDIPDFNTANGADPKYKLSASVQSALNGFTCTGKCTGTKPGDPCSCVDGRLFPFFSVGIRRDQTLTAISWATEALAGVASVGCGAVPPLGCSWWAAGFDMENFPVRAAKGCPHDFSWNKAKHMTAEQREVMKALTPIMKDSKNEAGAAKLPSKPSKPLEKLCEKIGFPKWCYLWGERSKAKLKILRYYIRKESGSQESKSSLRKTTKRSKKLRRAKSSLVELGEGEEFFGKMMKKATAIVSSPAKALAIKAVEKVLNNIPATVLGEKSKRIITKWVAEIMKSPKTIHAAVKDFLRKWVKSDAKIIRGAQILTGDIWWRFAGGVGITAGRLADYGFYHPAETVQKICSVVNVIQPFYPTKQATRLVGLASEHNVVPHKSVMPSKFTFLIVRDDQASFPWSSTWSGIRRDQKYQPFSEEGSVKIRRPQPIIVSSAWSKCVDKSKRTMEDGEKCAKQVGESKAPKCAAIFQMNMKLCNSGCCADGEMGQSEIHTDLVYGDKAKCGAWMSWADWMYRSYAGGHRAILMLDKSANGIFGTQ